MFGGRNHLAPLHLYCHWCKVLSPTIPEFWLLLVSARCSYESHSTHTPVKPGQSNMPSASGQPLPSAAAAQLQQLVTSSRSRRLSQKVCLFTKPRQTRHLPCRRVQSLSRVIWAGQWKMKAQTGAGALEHVSGWCSQRPADGQVEEGRVQEMRTARMGGVKPRPSLGPTSFLFDTLWYVHSTWAQTVSVRGDEQGLVRRFMGCAVCLLITRFCDVSLITPTGIIKL